MAKKIIHDLTKELVSKGIKIDNKEIISFLESKGIGGKTHSSAIEDNEIKMVEDRFSGAPKTENEADMSKEPPKKKKSNIIFAINTGNSRNGVTNRNGRQVGHINAGRIEDPGAHHQIIKPSVKPSPAPEVNIIRSGQPAVKPKTDEIQPADDKKEQIIAETKNTDAPVQSVPKKVQPDLSQARSIEERAARINQERRQDSQNRQGDRRPSGNYQGQSRPQGTGYQGQSRPQGTGYQGQSRPQGTGYQGQSRPQGTGYQNRGTSYAGRPNNGGAGRTSGGNGGAYRTGSYSGNSSYSSQGRTGGYNNANHTGAYGQNRGSFGQNRPEGQGSYRPYGNGGINGGRSGGFSRPGFKTGVQGKSAGFEVSDQPKDAERHRSDADRRRQSEARRRKEANYAAAAEEDSKKKLNPHRFIKPAPVEKKPEEEIKVITIPESLTIKDLADHMKIQPSSIIKKLFLAGQIVTLNSEVSYEDAENIAIDYEIMCEHEKQIDVIAELLKEDEEDETKMEKRPPVVCVMGHVDHGKTSLLDTIRKAHVTDREAGGITQAIGAYTVNINGRKITFLDTPGHEAFTAMRMRGATATDIVILVVAADDGVMPQTVEAINHAKAANVEIIVAVNKIDKPNANIDRVKQELAEYELVPEDWGGSTIFAPVSAKSGEGVDNLLEMILLSADMLELKANPDRQARGLVIEAELDKGRGPVATVLVQKGTLHVGDFVACGACHGKVRAMVDDKGKRVKEAGPSIPVEILGLNSVPDAGEIFVSPGTEKEAQDFANTYIAQHKKDLLNETKKKTMTLDDLYSQIKEGDLKEFNVIIKADVQGSVEALTQSLLKLSNDEVAVKVIHGGVGAINESDVILASASNAVIIGFNVRPDAMAKATADQENVDIRLYKVIYQAIDDVEAAMKGMLEPVFEEKVIGHGEIRQIFKASGLGNISGSYVTDGVVERGCSVRITRGEEQIFDGKLASLKRFKDDAKEVREGFECGLVFEDFDKVQEEDRLEFYKMVEVERS